MKTDQPIIPVIYTLPKIHKSQTVPLVGRPIVSGIGSLTNNVSTYVDHLLKPWVTSLSSYTRDSIDFIKKRKTITVPSECLLVTLDVSSLYTSKTPLWACSDRKALSSTVFSRTSEWGWMREHAIVHSFLPRQKTNKSYS